MAKLGAWTLTAVVAAIGCAVACSNANSAGAPVQGGGDDASTMGTGDDAGSGGSAEGGGGCIGKLPPAMDPSKLPSCCSDGPAHCVPGDDVPAPFQAALASCSGGFCVPDEFVTNPSYVPPACKAFNGSDGVCLSVCVPQVAMYKTILQQGSCGASELCAPCVNPLTMQSSHACDIGHMSTCADAGGGGSGDGGEADAGKLACPYEGPPVIDPNSLPSCSPDGGAHCLDKTLVPPSMQSQLAACGASGLCVPDVFIATAGNYIPATCDSLGGDEGRCLHEAIPKVASQKDQLPVSSCKPYERCVPCYDPRDLSDTGACHLSCDPGPARGKPSCPHHGPPYMDPTQYPSCDPSNSDHCLDASMVSPSLQSQLATCGNGGFCVPDVFSENAGRYVPPTCTSLIGAEGRCMNVAIPKVAAQASQLPQDVCQSYERCVPCYSPVDGSDTGACRLSCDPGPQQPPALFQDCCGGGAKCVPSQIIPQNEQANLTQDVCSDPSTLCVPTEMLAQSFTPPSCTGSSIAYLGTYSGVCLSDCLSFSFFQSLVIEQGTCDDSHQCVPCYTPLGSPTGAPGCQ